MNLETFFSNLEFLFDPKQEIGLSMYMIIENDNSLIKKKADIDQEVIAELKKQFLENIKLKFLNNDELNYSEISEATERRKTLFHYDLPDKPTGLNVLDELLADENTQLFSFSTNDYNTITGFVFLLGNATNKIAIYKKMYPVTLMKRDSILMLKKADSRLVKVKEDILKVNSSFEFMKIGSDLFATNLEILEKYFGFEKIIRDQAALNLGVIEKSKLLEDISPLVELSSELKFARRIMRLKKDSPVLKLPFKKVSDFVKNHPKLKKSLKLSLDGKSFALDTKKSKELFLKLLDDDYLKSELTNLLYESEIKDPLSIEV